MRGKAHLVAVLLVVVACLVQPAVGHAAEVLEEDGARDYRAMRSLVIGLAAVGVLVGLAGMGMHGDHPEGFIRARGLAVLCALLFLMASLDRIIIRGIAGWFLFPADKLPPWWR